MYLYIHKCNIHIYIYINTCTCIHRDMFMYNLRLRFTAPFPSYNSILLTLKRVRRGHITCEQLPKGINSRITDVRPLSRQQMARGVSRFVLELDESFVHWLRLSMASQLHSAFVWYRVIRKKIIYSVRHRGKFVQILQGTNRLIERIKRLHTKPRATGRERERESEIDWFSFFIPAICLGAPK